MGATSIRGILGVYEDGQISFEEVMRYNHEMVAKDGINYWNIDGLLENIYKTVIEHGGTIESIGVDTWGVDYGLIDDEGNLVASPMAYRNDIYAKGLASIEDKISLKDLYLKTGNQIMDINTLFQLETLRKEHPDLLDKAKVILMTPNLINYFLSGEKYGEKTICSTSQMFDLEAGDWNYKLFEDLGFDKDLLPEVTEKTVIGSTKNSSNDEINKFDIKVLQVPSHDTASATYLTEAYDNLDTLFISSGTWSLVGCFTDNPIITEESYNYDLTNETGFAGKNMFFKNITGLYLIEQLKKAIEAKEGQKLSFDEITRRVHETEDFSYYVDVYDEELNKQTDDFIGVFEKYLDDNAYQKSVDPMEYFRLLYQSIVESYVEVVEYIEHILDRKFKKAHIIGGGSQSEILCQLVADKLGLAVIAGPKEATGMGNILSQVEILEGREASLKLREYILNSEEIKIYK